MFFGFLFCFTQRLLPTIKFINSRQAISIINKFMSAQMTNLLLKEKADLPFGHSDSQIVNNFNANRRCCSVEKCRILNTHPGPCNNGVWLRERN
ncbi:unnamed protein product, partial [Nesidiocoris tenuis]